MPNTPTNAELIEMGRKALAQRERDRKRTIASTKALKRVALAHKDEYSKYLAEEMLLVK